MPSTSRFHTSSKSSGGSTMQLLLTWLFLTSTYVAGGITDMVFGSQPASEPTADTIKPLIATFTMEKADEAIAFLLAGDDRLIRHDLPSDEAEENQEAFCSKHLEAVLGLLVSGVAPDSGVSVENQTKLVNIVSLCSSENPDAREEIGSFKDGVALKSILSLLDKNEPMLDAVVGKAVWTLSFNDKENHDFFVHNGAIAKMSSLIVSGSDKLDSEDTEEKAEYTLSIMWMAAAPQNLAASYCDTDTGVCLWEYDEADNEDGEEGGLFLHEESPMVIDGSFAAELITTAEDGELVELLQNLVCQPPMDEGQEAHWPSLATLDNAMHAASDTGLLTWAAAGVLKNLSMYGESEDVTREAMGCLCDISLSQDWLEASKAEDALFRIGVTEDDCREQPDGEEEDFEDEEESDL